MAVDMTNFAGCFGDFATMFLDTDFEQYVVRFYDEGGSAYFKQVIGYTELANDVLLHLVDAENCDTYEELDESLEDHGVEFQLLSKMIGTDGFAIIPMDQVVDEDELEDDDDGCLGYLSDDEDDDDDICPDCGENFMDCECEDDDEDDED